MTQTFVNACSNNPTKVIYHSKNWLKLLSLSNYQNPKQKKYIKTVQIQFQLISYILQNLNFAILRRSSYQIWDEVDQRVGQHFIDNSLSRNLEWISGNLALIIVAYDVRTKTILSKTVDIVQNLNVNPVVGWVMLKQFASVRDRESEITKVVRVRFPI